MKEKKRLIKNKVDIERLMACLVAHFKQIFEYFKHTYTHFYSLFHPYVYKKHSKNITQTPLPNISFWKIQKTWDCFIHEKLFFFFQSVPGCLVCVFKQPFSVFKHHFTHFNVLFHSHIFLQIFSNNNFQFLNRY